MCSDSQESLKSQISELDIVVDVKRVELDTEVDRLVRILYILCIDWKFDEIDAAVSMRTIEVLLVEAIILGFHSLALNIFIAGSTNNNV